MSSLVKKGYLGLVWLLIVLEFFFFLVCLLNWLVFYMNVIEFSIKAQSFTICRALFCRQVIVVNDLGQGLFFQRPETQCNSVSQSGPGTGRESFSSQSSQRTFLQMRCFPELHHCLSSG